MADGRALVLHIAATAEAVGPALDQLEEYLGRNGFGPALCGKVMVVADEVISNIARCAFPGTDGASFTVSLTPETVDGARCLRLVATDAGIAFDPTARAAPDIGLPLEERDAGSLGIHLVRGMCRTLAYTRDAELNRLDALLDVD